MNKSKNYLGRRAGETAHYEDDPFGVGDIDESKLLVVNDFLPRPEELVFKGEETVKVSMVLDKESVDFFKAEAKRLHVSYQRMIRNLLREYTQRMKQGEQVQPTT